MEATVLSVGVVMTLPSFHTTELLASDYSFKAQTSCSAALLYFSLVSHRTSDQVFRKQVNHYKSSSVCAAPSPTVSTCHSVSFSAASGEKSKRNRENESENGREGEGHKAC